MKIAIIDSGIHATHPHAGLVAGAIREKVPDTELYAVKVFDQRLSTNIDSIVRAFEWCIEHRMDVINLSLGTSNETHRRRFERIISPAILMWPPPTCCRDLSRSNRGRTGRGLSSRSLSLPRWSFPG